MKNTDIQKIRQLLKTAQKAFWNDEGWTWFQVETSKVLPLIDKALALLPCETCGGTGKKLISGCWGMVHKEIPCPDCQ